VFERFTEGARQVVVLAQDEARSLKHNYIGTEHILLGLLREEEGLAARVLESLDITVEEVRAQVARIVGQGDEVTTGQIPFTPRAKKVLELSLREARGLGHDYIGTEHILLGLARENSGVGPRILLDFDVDARKIQTEVIRMLSRPEHGPIDSSAELRDEQIVVEVPQEDRVYGYGGETSSHTSREPIDRLRLPLVVAIVLAALSFPLGLLLGWLVWGR
jgi:ATP-dependent Clp protease ATP-binding subunit ClpA